MIELLVVIAIIALLSATVFASIAVARIKSRDANRIATARSLKLALGLYEDSHGGVIGINGISGDSGMQILTVVGTTTIAQILLDEKFLSQKISNDPVFGNNAYFLGVTHSGVYDVYAKLERGENSMSSAVINNSADGPDALAAGFNYVSGFGDGVGKAGGGAVAH